MGAPHGSIEQRLWMKVSIGGVNECWVWNGACVRKGHGVMWAGRNGNERLVHRISWIIANGKIPDNLCVLHKCDNPPCVNPRHLFLGTVADNNRDMWGKKRGRIKRSDGENNNSAKLTYENVHEIRKLRKAGWKLKDLAKKFSVCVTTIHWITSGKHWKNVS